MREIYARAMPSTVINGAKNHVKIEALQDAIAEQQKQLAAKDEVIKTLEKKLGYVTTETANNSTTISDLLRRLEKLEGKKDDTDKKDDTKTT
jgi:septal ring factor EnvC (AmiA/AmiB activator)